MKTKNFIIGTLVGAIIYFLLGWLVYGVFFKDIYPNNGEFSHTMLFLIIGNLFFGAMIAYIFTKWAGITNWWTGAKAGAVLGLFYSASMNFFMYSGREVNYQNLFLDIILNVIMVGIVGSAIAWAIGRFAK